MKRSAFWLIVSAAVLFAIGLLMVFNTTAAEIIDRSLDKSTHAPLLRQLSYAIFGLCIGTIAYFIGYERLLRWSFPLCIAGTAVLALLFVPGIGQVINGARRWIFLFGISFQPSEGMKILLPAAFIHWTLRCKEPIRFTPFLQLLGCFSLPLGLILFEPDNGAVAILLVLLVLLFVLAGIRWVYWVLPLFLLLSLGAIAAYQMPHARDRIRIYLHPELDLRGKGHQPHQAKIAAGSGQLFGRGFGESLQKLNYLPEARSDYIAAIFAEETGFIGIVGLIGLYLSFAYAGLSIALRAPDKEGLLFAAALTFLVSIQAFLNLGVVSGLLPSKGMNLPFFSQGGSSLMTNIIALFLLLDISRKARGEYGIQD